MNELLPYEQPLAGKLAEAPLPNIDGAWDAMRKMLEEEDDDDGVVPPVSKGCRGAGIGMLVLAMVAGVIIVFFMLRKGQTNNTLQQTGVKAEDSALVHQNNTRDGKKTVASDTLHVNEAPRLNDTTTALAKQQAPGTVQGKYKASSDISKERSRKTGIHISTPATAKTPAPVTTLQMRKHGDMVINGSPLNVTTKRLGDNVTDSTEGAHAISTGITHTNTTSHNDTSIITPRKPATQNSSNTVTGKPATPAKINKQADTAKTAPAVAGNGKKATGDDDITNRKPFWFGAGLAMQQLIPVDGQKATPYNASGRKGSLGDYIPSVYARAYHGKKMLQVEFKYGAPQYAKDVAYDKKIVSHDSTTGITISNVSRVKKTYYHQLPVSFHYSVLPNLTIGGGFVWNRFQSAVVQNETQRSSGLGSDSLVSSKLITLKSDSATAFAKSYFQFMAEAQYTYKRFSIGARYAWGLQPYLTISSSVNVQAQKERNASLNIFIRYELWQSKKKK